MLEVNGFLKLYANKNFEDLSYFKQEKLREIYISAKDYIFNNYENIYFYNKEIQSRLMMFYLSF